MIDWIAAILLWLVLVLIGEIIILKIVVYLNNG